MEPSIDSELQAAMQPLQNNDADASVATLEALLARPAKLPEVPEILARGILATALAALGRIEQARTEREKAIWLASDLGDGESRAHYQSLLQPLDIVGMSDNAIEQAFERASKARDRGSSARRTPPTAFARSCSWRAAGRRPSPRRELTLQACLSTKDCADGRRDRRHGFSPDSARHHHIGPRPDAHPRRLPARRARAEGGARRALLSDV